MLFNSADYVLFLPLVLLVIGLMGSLIVLWRKRRANQRGEGS